MSRSYNRTAPRKSADDRFFSKVRLPRENGCWPWMAGKNSSGYGHFWTGEWRDEAHKRPICVQAHRWAYERFVGPIPEGMCVLHSCDEPDCVYPKHLFLGTQADNVADCAAKGRRNQVRPRAPHKGKVSTADRLEMRRLRAETDLTLAEIGERFGVRGQTVGYWERHTP